MKTFNEYETYLLKEANAIDIYRKLIATGKVDAHSKQSEPRVFNPGDKLSDADFIKLIKDTFDGVKDVTKEPPPNIKSHTNTLFKFQWNGADQIVVLAGEVKGRGSKQTNEQEVSWLLVLSAYYEDKSQTDKDKKIVDFESLKEVMLARGVFERVYGVKGSALDRNGALGLVQWLEKNGGKDAKEPTGWLKSHMNQCKKFVKDYTKTPTRFVKDRSNLNITAVAKGLFPKAVPDQTFDKDKWNPADVWLEYEEIAAPTGKGDKFTARWGTLAELNNYLYDSIKGKISGVLGVSLKLGDKGVVTKINIKGERPEYNVTDFDLKFGDLFAQNVPAEYEGTYLEGYSVMYRVFDAKATSTIRGEAQVKKGLAAQGKVYLKYLDFLMGGKRTYVRRIEAVKGILVKEIPNSSRNSPNQYEFTKQGLKAFKIIQKAWPLLRDSDIIEYGKGKIENYNKILDKPRTPTGKEFLDYVAEYAHKNRIDEIGMQTRVSVRFQTIRLGSLFAGIKRGSAEKLHQVALGMLLYGKSESEWSAPHLKAQ